MKCKDGKCKGKCKGKKCPKKCDDCVEKHITKELTEKRKKAVLRAKINSKFPIPIDKLPQKVDSFAWANQLPPQQIIPKLKREDLAFTLKDIENKIEEAFKKYESRGSAPRTDTKAKGRFGNVVPDKNITEAETQYEPQDDNTYELPEPVDAEIPNAFNFDSVGSHTLVPNIEYDDEFASIEPGNLSIETELSEYDENESDGEFGEFDDNTVEPDETSHKYDEDELTQVKGVHPLLRDVMEPQRLSFFGTKPEKKEVKPTLERTRRKNKEMGEATEMGNEDTRTDDREAGFLPNQPTLFQYMPIDANINPPKS